MIMRYLSLICMPVIGIFLVLLSCKSNPSNSFIPQNGTFEKEQINAATTTLNAHDNLLLAGTSKGVFKKQLDPKTNWVGARLQIDSAQVVDFVVLNKQEIVSAILYDNAQQHKPTLFKSNDSGISWDPINLTKPEEYDYFVVHFLELLRASNTKDIIAYAGTIIQSTDKGKSWSTIYKEGLFSEFLSVSQYHANQIWTGGWTNIFSPYLAKSEDGGNSWTLLNQQVYTGSDGTVYDAILHPKKASDILIALTGIQRSTDGGETWQSVYNKSHINTFTHSARNPEVVYASGENVDGTLFFSASQDFGDSWEMIEMPDSPADIQVNDLVSVMEDDHEVLYFGTDQGIFSYTFSE